jgi:hypothetical protein
MAGNSNSGRRPVNNPNRQNGGGNLEKGIKEMFRHHPNKLAAIVNKLYDMAKDGNLDAIKILLERESGKVKEVVEHQVGNSYLTIEGEGTEIADAIMGFDGEQLTSTSGGPPRAAGILKYQTSDLTVEPVPVEVLDPVQELVEPVDHGKVEVLDPVQELVDRIPMPDGLTEKQKNNARVKALIDSVKR